MLSPNYLDYCADDILMLYEKLNSSIINDIARRIAKISVTTTSVHQMQILQESGEIFQASIKKISKISGESDKKLKKLFLESGLKAIEYDDSIYIKAGLKPLPIKQSTMMLNILAAGILKTKGNMKNLTMTTALASQQAYISAVNIAYMQVSSGAFDLNRAVTNAIKSVANKGVSTIYYPTGHHDKLDVAIRRAVVTGVNQTSAQLQLMRASEIGNDLVETTAHSGARPSHEEWQGQIFSISGRSGKYPNFEDTTGYGTGEGLCGYNCRHNFFPFFEEFSVKSYSDQELKDLESRTVEYNGREIKQYEATQMQRGQERAIRATKREIAALESAINTTNNGDLKTNLRKEFEVNAVKLKNQENKLQNFIKQTRLQKDSSRTKVNGFNKSIAQKAVWANKKAN